MPKRPATADRRDRFLEYLKTLGPGDECVYWPWSDKRSGYTRIYVNNQKVNAHRWVFEQLNGPLPPVAHSGPRGDATQVCHTCDNPPCIRPSHLFPGTGTVNIRDASAKGRMHSRGSSGQRRRQMTIEEIRSVRLLLRTPLSQQQIANMLGISRMAVNRIALGRAYRDLA